MSLGTLQWQNKVATLAKLSTLEEAKWTEAVATTKTLVYILSPLSLSLFLSLSDSLYLTFWEIQLLQFRVSPQQINSCFSSQRIKRNNANLRILKREGNIEVKHLLEIISDNSYQSPGSSLEPASKRREKNCTTKYLPMDKPQLQILAP
jgi:hypothetical protein